MRATLLITLAFVLFNSLCAIDVFIHDPPNQYFLNSTLGFNITVHKEGSKVVNNVIIQNATAIPGNVTIRDRSTFYEYEIRQSETTSFVKAIYLTLEAQKSENEVRRYIKEFELSLTFDESTEMKNWTGLSLPFVVRPPKFPHFQVKTDWQYSCPKVLHLGLCHVENGTNACSQEKPFSLLEVRMTLANITFNGGKPVGHDYSSKIEECPLNYETKKDIGIACIAVLWSIAGAFAIWGLVKFLLKRHRKRMD